MTWTERRVEVSGAQRAYLEWGDFRLKPEATYTPEATADVLLLLHAFPVGMRLWEPQVIPDGWRAIAPALPGFDGTALPPADSTAIDDYARAALDLLDALHIDTCVVAGVSMGGYAAFGVLRHARPRCRALILADSRSGADTEQGRAARDAMLAQVRARGAAAVADEMLPKLLGATTHTSRPHVVASVRALIESQSTEAIAAAILRLRDRPDSTDLLRGLQVPALIVVGEEDTLTPPAESEKMRDAIPRADLVRIPGAGHLANMEAPEVFNAALARFLSSVP